MFVIMNKLDAYLAAQGMPNAEFGRRVGASESTISRIRHGKQAPSFALARRIKESTEGAVTADDLMAATMPTAASPENDNPAAQITTAEMAE
ncbi:MAG: hypothetical protein DI549_10895 [Ancylobacter novellus]|uniref:HTH cro/C1-type domain-containing protein n=1 Tax=Ancylobacter novellus TaxID=921 RepID=A0A2W5QZ66_ANCNO|nr:MAG: hypothetical protein DI549_10895 [Ancylobacter novellus]